jgi:hypothetical protein
LGHLAGRDGGVFIRKGNIRVEVFSPNNIVGGIYSAIIVVIAGQARSGANVVDDTVDYGAVRGTESKL